MVLNTSLSEADFASALHRARQPQTDDAQAVSLEGQDWLGMHPADPVTCSTEGRAVQMVTTDSTP